MNRQRWRFGCREQLKAVRLRLVSSLHGPEGTLPINAVPVAGEVGLYDAKFTFSHRGEYAFHLDAYTGSTLAEHYERKFVVEPSIEEGADPELKSLISAPLAARAKGVYVSEKDLGELEKFLQERVLSQPSLNDDSVG